MKVSENWRPRWWRETHKEKHCGWIIFVRVVRMRIRWWFCLINYFFVGWLDVVVLYFDIFCLDIRWFLVMIVHHGLLWFILINDNSHYGPIISIHRYPTIAIVDFFLNPCRIYPVFSISQFSPCLLHQWPQQGDATRANEDARVARVRCLNLLPVPCVVIAIMARMPYITALLSDILLFWLDGWFWRLGGFFEQV